MNVKKSKTDNTKRIRVPRTNKISGRDTTKNKTTKSRRSGERIIGILIDFDNRSLEIKYDDEKNSHMFFNVDKINVVSKKNKLIDMREIKL